MLTIRKKSWKTCAGVPRPRMRSFSIAVAAAMLATLILPAVPASAGPRPNFQLPFPCGQEWSLFSWKGHNPDDKKIDMTRIGGETRGSTAVAAAAGRVHQWFDPGGLEIDHGNGWFSVYLHMSSRVPVGTQVAQGQRVGTVDSIGTGTPHLHYEQLSDSNGDGDGETNEMVHSVFNGVTYNMGSNGEKSYRVRSNNSCGSGPGPAPGPQQYWVDTFEDAPGHSSPGGARTGTLYKGTHYVFCKVQGPKKQVGDDYNHWWLKTDLDTGQKDQWVSAYYLTRWGNDEARDNGGQEIPNC